jgi:hypothetical protein
MHFEKCLQVLQSHGLEGFINDYYFTKKSILFY